MSDRSTHDAAARQEESSCPTASLSESLTKAAKILSCGKPEEAVPLLVSLQTRVASAALFSSNESLDDVATSSLPLLSVEFHLASALLQLRYSSSIERKANVVRSSELFHAFLRTLDDLGGLLGDDLTRDYQSALDEHDRANGDDDRVNGGIEGGVPWRPRSSPENREAKIARFRARKAAEEDRSRLLALRDRRGRMGATDDEELDGHDMEGLERALAVSDLRRMAAEALDEARSTSREMEMLEMAARMEGMSAGEERHRSGVPSTQGAGVIFPGKNPSAPPPNRRGIQVTRVTQDPTTGQLQLKKEVVRAQVFRPGWNQPTMTLAEYGDMEVARAMEREARQKVAEEENRGKPRRYEALERDGMEDNADLVDASAKLDREWDNWKDDNPKGSGNKMGDRGDRNF